MQKTRMPVYFISHGGGPWPWLEGDFRRAHNQLEQSLQRLPQELPETPKAILIISGHWEEKDFTIMTNPKPPMIYDYSGFPANTYQVKYAAPGSPELAAKVKSLLTKAGLTVQTDSQRGFDHGTFAPLAVAFPSADIPVVQLSIRADYDPELHIKAGEALSFLREEGVLIIGSGLSFHNMRMLDPKGAKPSHEFDAWLQQTLIKSNPQERRSKLVKWNEAPAARTAHPDEDHLLPLMVAVGAAGTDPAKLSYHDDRFLGGVAASSFQFG